MGQTAKDTAETRYLFSRAILEEVEGAGRSDDSSVAERRGIDQGTREIE
jgi:hypothetical protein